ncbi:MAG: ABC transporter permease [Clostridiales bacterium]|jgi:putative ABC transport system permease protein|nr:ABC transporter permease [Clostridiales bacterium]
MRIKDIFRSGVSSIISNRMRSILTMLGIIIGISSVILITSLGNGFKAQIEEELSAYSTSAVQVRVDSSHGVSFSDMLTMRDVRQIEEISEVSSASGICQSLCDIKLKDPREDSFSQGYIAGVSEGYSDVVKMDLIYGRFISAGDVERESEAAVIEDKLARKVFGRENAVGERIELTTGGKTIRPVVAGVLKTKDSTVSALIGSDIPTVYMPVTTYMKIADLDTVTSVAVTFKSDENLRDKVTTLKRFLEITHNNSGKYNVSALRDQIGSITMVLDGITAFIALVAAISLIVGGIGVMNIMLVTVTERTREIGIRKSLGATDGSISKQFLAEAVIMTLIGGLLGVMLGYWSASSIGVLVKINAVVSMKMVIISCAVSSFIGIVFGVYPARKASKMNPIDALRYE